MVKKLTKESFEKAKKWILENGRPLEKALIKHHFDGKSPTKIFDALKSFQNPDGGFGHALEPDLRTTSSSILGTSLALQVLRMLQPEFIDEHIVEQAIQYILKNYNQVNQSWRIIPEEAETSPHAPWWNQNDRKEEFQGFHLNPTAEILGYLYDYKNKIPEELLFAVSVKVLQHLIKLEEIEMHEFLCCKRLVEAKNLEDSYKQEIQKELNRLLPSCIVTDSSQWGGYGLRPLQVVDSPGSAFLQALGKLVEENLDYEINNQDRSGVWLPTWTWGDYFPDEWNQAKKDWTGIITCEKLNILRKFGRIEL